MGVLDRTLSTISRGELITPYIEQAVMTADWPPEYPVKVYNKERVWDGYFHPSSDPYAGEILLYCKFNPELQKGLLPEHISPSLAMTFQVGSALHAIIQSMLIHLGFTTEEEVEVSYVNEERHTSGTTDIRKLTLPNGREVMVDIKTCSKLPTSVRANYKTQLRIYQDNVPDAPDEMVILYIEKAHPHGIRDFIVEKDPDELNMIYAKWNRVLEAVEFNDPSSLTPCCTGSGDKTFDSCPAREVCPIWNR
jgi:hypothetical protein